MEIDLNRRKGPEGASEGSGPGGATKLDPREV